MNIILLRKARRFVKKAEKLLKFKLLEELEKIVVDPEIGKRLRGAFMGDRAHKFIYRGTSYRILYRVENNLLIITIATCENFYKKS